MTNVIVSSGVTSSGLNVSSGNSLVVLSGGTADVTTVLSGGTMTLSSGSLSSDVTVSSGGKLAGAGELLGDSYDLGGQVSGLVLGDLSLAADYLAVESGGSTSGLRVVCGAVNIDSARPRPARC